LGGTGRRKPSFRDAGSSWLLLFASLTFAHFLKALPPFMAVPEAACSCCDSSDDSMILMRLFLTTPRVCAIAVLTVLTIIAKGIALMSGGVGREPWETDELSMKLLKISLVVSTLASSGEACPSTST
jgi:hypothetical protein